MDAKHLFLALILVPAAHAETFEQQLARELNEGMDGRIESAEPIQADYNNGYGTRTDVYLTSDGRAEVDQHMASGAKDELRVYDWQDQGRELQPGLRKLWGE